MRFLPSLTAAQQAQIRAIFTRKDLRERERKRFTAVLLSAQHRLCINELACLCQVSRHSIENWFDAYQQGGFSALLDGELAHHPSSLAAYEPKLVMEAVEENAQNLPLVVEQLAQQHQIPTTVGILKRYLKKDWTWRRVQQSLKSQRDEAMVTFFTHELRALRHWQATGPPGGGEIELWYYDESGFQLNPNGLYAWQAPHSLATLPAQRGNVLTVAGFLTTDNRFEGYYHQGAMDAELFIAYMEDFIRQRVSKKTVVVLDRASFHTAQQVQLKIKHWQAQNLFIQFLPAYSSELNLIEHLWRLVKHHWLPISAWQSSQQLTQQVLDILKNIGTTYRIDFDGPSAERTGKPQLNYSIKTSNLFSKIT